MNKHTAINKHSVHLWRIDLHTFLPILPELASLLSADETDRAKRFKFDIHRQRFIVSRAMLRRILSRYTHILPHEIRFDYGQHGKPYLHDNVDHIHFNLSHSDDLAVIAVVIDQEIGVDIEKMEPTFKDEVAKRFFSQQEYHALRKLPEEEKVIGFYRIWSKKEAVIKALGEGLYVPLDSFSLSIHHGVEELDISHHAIQRHFHVESFFVDDDFQAAFATDQAVVNIEYFPTP